MSDYHQSIGELVDHLLSPYSLQRGFRYRMVHDQVTFVYHSPRAEGEILSLVKLPFRLHDVGISHRTGEISPEHDEREGIQLFIECMNVIRAHWVL